MANEGHIFDKTPDKYFDLLNHANFQPNKNEGGFVVTQMMLICVLSTHHVMTLKRGEFYTRPFPYYLLFTNYLPLEI